MVRVKMNHLDIAMIADSGQCFRLNRTAADAHMLIAKGKILRITETAENQYEFDCDAADFDEIWKPYFDLNTDYDRFIKSIAPQDIFLQNAAAYGSGIRILQQDAFEMLITFIISQRKNIPAIKKCVETLCTQFGAPISQKGDCAFAFPTAKALAAQSLESLRACALGYRANYVRAAAVMVESHALDLEKAEKLDDVSLYNLLQSVSGVGPKVANCVLLFGFHRIASFPQDVWINRMIDAEYGGVFPLAQYQGYAGVLQQYIFYYARSDAYAALKR
ncbi:MAG: DNA glycosylase [Ruthenibacterium sp.]